MIHIWHEDSTNSSTQQFWEFLRNNNVSKALDDADIRGFNGNENLQAYIEEEAKFNKEDTYYIFMDYVLDNEWALKTWMSTMKFIQEHSLGNVKMVKLNCFEFMIIDFTYFIEWVKPIDKQSKDFIEAEKILNIYRKLIRAGKSWQQNKNLLQYTIKAKGVALKDIKNITSEQLSTLILSKMTNGGKLDFGISKTHLGKCWTESCCSNNRTRIEKVCNIYYIQYTSKNKANKLWKFAANKYLCVSDKK